MRLNVIARLAAAVFLTMAPASHAGAATLIVDASGQLTGAAAVNVNGTLYDVTLVDSNCAAQFGSCDPAHFDFSSFDNAYAAAQALAALIIGSPFDHDPVSVLDCLVSDCKIFIPYTNAFFYEQQYSYGGTVTVTPTGTYASIDAFTNEGGLRIARFMPAAVPEPATWAMMLLGFSAIGFARRRRKSARPRLARFLTPVSKHERCLTKSWGVS